MKIKQQVKRIILLGVIAVTLITATPLSGIGVHAADNPPPPITTNSGVIDPPIN